MPPQTILALIHVHFVLQKSAVAVASSEKLALTAQELPPLMSQADPPPAMIEEPSLIGALASSQHLKGKPHKVRTTLEGNFNPYALEQLAMSLVEHLMG